MENSILPLIFVLIFLSLQDRKVFAEKIKDEVAIKQFLRTVNEQGTKLCISSKAKFWEFQNNLNSQEAKSSATKGSLAYWKFWKEKSDESKKYDLSNINDERIKRIFHIISIYGEIVTNQTQLKKFTEAKQAMQGIYSKAKICDFYDKSKCNLTLEPDLTLAMQKTQKEQVEALKYYWLAFRNATGKKMRQNYTILANIIHDSVANGEQGYKTVSEAETSYYETPTLKNDVAVLWNQLEPFYKQLHAYVRYKLYEHYGSEHISLTGPLPAHLLGNMWAQSWSNIFEYVVPFPLKKNIDVTPKLIELQMKPVDMAKMAESFFQSMGFPKLPAEFWSGSVLEKPNDGREITCHASAWDMCDGKNFRIQQCTGLTFEDFLTLHHEMGHIYYQMLYRNQPILFRDGGNPAFHESIGDLISLSVQTPKHLQTIGLLDEIDDEDDEADINYLLSVALEHIAFLPFGYLVDQWRWNVFQQIIHPDNYNCEWWKLKVNIQGIAPPEQRSEDDFDPGAKFHVATNSGYIRYFISSIIQFQFHEALCKVAGKYDSNRKSPALHKCDIYGSKLAGDKLMKMLSLGYSKPWPDAMEIVTGQRSMNASSMLEYFHPLIKWLEKENERLNLSVGWKHEKLYCKENPKPSSNSNSHKAFKITTVLLAILFIVVSL